MEDQDRIEAVRKMRQGKPPMTFKEIGDVLGCAPQEAAQLGRRAQGREETEQDRGTPQPAATKAPYLALQMLSRIMKFLAVVLGLSVFISAMVALNRLDDLLGEGLFAVSLLVVIATVIVGGVQVVFLWAIADAATLLVGLHSGMIGRTQDRARAQRQ